MERVLVKPTIAHFVTEYALRLAYPNRPATEAILIITPAGDFLR
jgi:hypothetical protein